MAMLRQAIMLVLVVTVLAIAGAVAAGKGQAAPTARLVAQALQMYSLEPGWPQTVGGPVSAPALADVDGDGLLEIVAATGDGRVYVWRHDGTLLSGWPQTTGGPICVFSAAAVSDLDGDGSPEIVAASGDGFLYAWHANGTLLAGWPVAVGGANSAWGMTASPSLGDLDGDGHAEVILAVDGQACAWRADGTPLPGWPQVVEATSLASPALADVDGDGSLEIALAGGSGNTLFRRDGSVLAQWGNPWSHAPVLADVDQDATPDVVSTDAGGAVSAQHADSAMLEGWPATTKTWPSDLALADLDGDGDLETVAASCSGRVSAWKPDGSPLAGWPMQGDGGRCTSPVIGDIDEDGQLEVVLAAGQLWAWHADGSRVHGFPIASLDPTCHGPAPGAAPALGDIDSDGLCEIVVGAGNQLTVWKIQSTGTVTSSRAHLPWRMFKHDPARSSAYYTFDDVPTTYWDWAAIEQAAAQGIMIGYADNVSYLDHPELVADRDQMAMALYRALESPTAASSALAAASASPDVSAEIFSHGGSSFVDVPRGYWAYDAIHALANSGITQGYPVHGGAPTDREFLPTNPSTRAEMAVCLARALHLDTHHPPATPSFVDVPRTYWAYAEIEAAKAAGLASGWDTGSGLAFFPDQTLRRDQLAAFLMRAFPPRTAAAAAASPTQQIAAPARQVEATPPVPAPALRDFGRPLAMTLTSASAPSLHPVNATARAGTPIAWDAVVDYEQTAFPTKMAFGVWYDATVTMRNTGTNTWTKADGYHLMCCNCGARDLWTTTEVALDDADAIAPGQEKTFHVPMQVLVATGYYYPTWSMAVGSEAFGERTSHPTPEPVAEGACTPAVSEQEVIFRSTPSAQPGFVPSPLFRYDLNTGATTQITSGDTMDSAPEIAGEHVAYQSWFADGHAALSVLNLATGVVQRFDDGGTIGQPDINGQHVVWTWTDSSSQTHLFLLDLATSQRVELDQGVGTPRVDGGRVAYVSTRAGLLRIYDIAQGRVTQELPFTSPDVDISGDEVAAFEVDVGAGIGCLTVINLATGTAIPPALCAGSWGQTCRISDGVVVWADSGIGCYYTAPRVGTRIQGGCHQPDIAGDTVVFQESDASTPTICLLRHLPRYVTVTGPGPDAAVVYEETSIPIAMVPGVWYDATVTMRNTGADTWIKADGYHLVSRNDFPDMWGITDVPLDDSDAIAPGQEKTFRFSIRRPEGYDSYWPAWSMAVRGLAFGEITHQERWLTADYLGLYRSDTSTFSLIVPGAAPLAAFEYAPPVLARLLPVAGDWHLSHRDSIGLYDPVSGAFYLRDRNTPGPPDSTFTFAPGHVGRLPVAGDWDGDGFDTIGLYDPETGEWFLRNSNTAGAPDIELTFGPAGANWQPVVGDWDGDGVDTIGLYDPGSGEWYLRYSNATGYADAYANWGPAGSAGKAVVGDWDGDGIDTLGLYDPVRGGLYRQGYIDTDPFLPYGPGGYGSIPLAGRWQ